MKKFNWILPKHNSTLVLQERVISDILKEYYIAVLLIIQYNYVIFTSFTLDYTMKSAVSPLHIAAREGKTECLKLLLKHKASVNAINQGD